MDKIFSGVYSIKMWEAINNLDEMSTGMDVWEALYFVCCRLQELESKYDKALDSLQHRQDENQLTPILRESGDSGLDGK